MDKEQIGAGGGADEALAAVRGLTPGLVDAWIDAAQPGAKLCYYDGWSLAAEGDETLRTHVYRRATAGFLFLYQGKKTLSGTRPYIAERSSRPVAGPSTGSGQAPKRPLTLHEQAREFAARGGR